MSHAIRMGCRALRRRPGFTITAVLTLALAVAANAAVFAIVYSILLKPLPHRDPDRLVAIWPGRLQSNADLLYLRDHAAMFSDIAAVAPGWTMALTGSGEPVKLTVARVSGNLFETLGVRPLLGRTLQETDARPGADGVVVLSHQLWQRQFAGDRTVVGRIVSLEGSPFEVVGVLGPDFEVFNLRTDAFTPFALDSAAWYHQLTFSMFAGRLAAGRTFEQADRSYRTLIPQVRRARNYPDAYGQTAHLQRLHAAVVGDVRSALVVLAAAVGIVLLIAGANVGTLLLTRAAARCREIAVRAAVGASRGRIALELVTEGTLVAILGGIAGTLLAWMSMPLVVALLPRDTPRTAEIAVDWRVACTAVGVSMLSGLLFALTPAFAAARVKTAGLLRAGTHSESRRSKRLRGLLATAEIAMALVLATAAGLMVQSLWRVQAIDPGFSAERVLTLHLQPTNVGGPRTRSTAAFYDTVLERLRALPGVRSAGAIQHLPFSGYSWNASLDVEGHSTPAGGQRPAAGLRIATPDYFASIGQPLVAGRDFESRDAERSNAVIVNQLFARTWFGDASGALGRKLRIRGGGIQSDWMTIMGVAGDVRHTSLTEPVRPEIYTSASATSISAMMIALRTDTDPLGIVPAVREAIWSVDRDVPISDVETMTAKIGGSLAQPRLIASVLSGFASISLGLVLVGVYAVVAYSVALRRREMAIMMALGAGRSRVLRLVLAEGLMYAGAGLAIGIPAALAASRLLRTVVHGIATTDPATYASLAIVVTAVVAGACLLPALRAARLEPARALASGEM